MIAELSLPLAPALPAEFTSALFEARAALTRLTGADDLQSAQAELGERLAATAEVFARAGYAVQANHVARAHALLARPIAPSPGEDVDEETLERELWRAADAAHAEIALALAASTWRPVLQLEVREAADQLQRPA